MGGHGRPPATHPVRWTVLPTAVSPRRSLRSNEDRDGEELDWLGWASLVWRERCEVLPDRDRGRGHHHDLDHDGCCSCCCFFLEALDVQRKSGIDSTTSRRWKLLFMTPCVPPYGRPVPY